MSFPTIPLGELGDIQTGSTPATSNEEFWGGDVPFVTPGELDAESPIYFAPRTLSTAGVENARLIKANSILVCCIGSLGKTGVAGRDLVTNQQINSIKFDETKILHRYGFHACRQLKDRLISIAPATTVPIVSKSKFAELKIPVPPISKQRRIAAILDKADALRAKRREALAHLDHLAQSIFVEMFGDPITGAKGCTPKKLADCVSKLEYGPRFYNEAYSSDGIRIVRITDLDQSGSLDFDAMPRMAVDEQTEKQFVLQPGDIVFARTGATVGKVALIRASDPPSIAGAYFIRLRFDESVLPLYAFSVLRAKSVQALIAKQSRQAAQQNFSGPGLRALPMPVPPMARQLTFAGQVEKIGTERQKFEASLAEMDMLISSLQHRAFTGEL